MAHSERSGSGIGHSSSSSSHSKPGNDKSGYRLVPTASLPPPQSSPKTLQKQTLQRTGSYVKRRSVSLNEASRPHGEASVPFLRLGGTPVPRLQPVPLNRIKNTKPADQDKDSMPNVTGTDNLEAQKPDVLSYKPRISEDASHGRSSSAPDNMRGGHRVKKSTGLAHLTNATLRNSVKKARGLGGTWYNPHDSTIVTPPRRESLQGKHGKHSAQLEKPLPPPPSSTGSKGCLDTSHSRSRSAPLSPGPGSGFYQELRSDSVVQLTPLVTPSTMDPNRKSYFPLSSDTQMRQLMGFSPVGDDEISSAPFQSRAHPPLPHGLGQSLQLPSSKYQNPLSIPAISVEAASKSRSIITSSHSGSPDKISEPAPSEHEDPTRPTSTFSQASSRWKPAALRITAPKRSASVSSGLRGRIVPPPLAPKKSHLAQLPTRSTSPKHNETEQSLTVWAELTTQTDSLHARYATLREDRQHILGAMTQALREQKPGPDYVNTVLDQQMSLATVCSSMDICLAKLKAVARRKDALAHTLVAQTPVKPSLSSVAEDTPVRTKFPPRTTSVAGSSTVASSTSSNTFLPDTTYGQDVNASQLPNAMARFQSKLDVDYDTDDSDAPRRVNIKGAKAAKILGLAAETSSPATKSSESSASRPTQNLQASLSTTSLDRELFTRAPTQAPDRPLPTRPSVRRKQRAHVPTPLPLKPIERSVVEKGPHATQGSLDATATSSRASSPAEDRGAETPNEEYPVFDDAKSPGMQTVHVYFPDSASYGASIHSSTFSEVGEDELLAYYGYLQ